MKYGIRQFVVTVLLPAALFPGSPATPASAADAWSREIPWRQAGLSERQAAAFLLDRFAFGARPAEVDEVVELGLGNWLEGQLAGDLPGSVLLSKLAPLSAITLEPGEIVRRYSYRKARIVRAAIAAGVITRADYSGDNGERNLRNAVATLERFVAEHGMQPETGLLHQLQAQKLLRAVYSESQLVEVLTDFWFNHFNVSATNGRARVHLMSYERDAIRPHVLGSFLELLGATARHPAMLIYLGNSRSVAGPEVTTTFDLEMRDLDRLSPLEDPTARLRLAKVLGWRYERIPASGKTTGLNENYARELMELHTLGVDGGFLQSDVIEVARAFTGWTVFPEGGDRERFEKALDRSAIAREMGFVVDSEFVFRADRHDAQAKTVLGWPLAAGRGIEDGEEVLDLVAAHPSTARHLAHKLAVRFVREDPPRSLVRRLVETWELTSGDLKEVVRTLVESPELWREAARRRKVKSPFELAASALRALDADISNPEETIRWLARMGQPLYSYSAPTGFPDRGATWTGVGQLLARANFSLDLARGRLSGVSYDPLRFLGRRQLESLDQAVGVYYPILMPERDAGNLLELIAGTELEPEPAEPSLTSDRTAELAMLRKTRQHAAYAVGLLLASPDFQLR